MTHTHDYPSVQRMREGIRLPIFDGASRPGEKRYAYKIGGFTMNMIAPNVFAEIEKIGESRPYRDALLNTPSIPQAYDLSKYFGIGASELLRTREREFSLLSNFQIVGQKNQSFLNTDADTLWFVIKGQGMIETILGCMPYEKNSFIYIPRSFLYMLCPHYETRLIGIRSTKPLRKPALGPFLNGDIPWGFHKLRLPIPFDSKKMIIEEENNPWNVPWPVLVFRDGLVTEISYKHCPFDCLAYSGEPYPFVLNLADINVPTCDTLHTDPTAFTILASEDLSIAVSVFKGRRIHSPPYYHLNQYDECLFYAGDYPARGGLVGKEYLTFHPQGFFHGPQPKGLEDWEKECPQTPDQNPWKEELAVMFESRSPLSPTEVSNLFSIPDYWKSWNKK